MTCSTFAMQLYQCSQHCDGSARLTMTGFLFSKFVLYLKASSFFCSSCTLSILLCDAYICFREVSVAIYVAWSCAFAFAAVAPNTLLAFSRYGMAWLKSASRFTFSSLYFFSSAAVVPMLFIFVLMSVASL